MDDLTSQGIQALKEGGKARAISLFLAALEVDADNAQAWLWLSGAVEGEQDRLDCLEQVLRIDPNNQAAVRGVALLRGNSASPAVSMSEPATVLSSLSMPEHAAEAAGAEQTSEAEGDASRKQGSQSSDAFLSPVEAGEEMFPGWMAEFTPENGSIPPAAAPAQAEPAPVEPQQTGPEPGMESPMAASLQAESAPAGPLQAGPEPGLESPAAAAPAASIQPAAEMPAVPARPQEHTLFKLQPSLITPVIVYGLGSVILFAASMAALLGLTGMDSPIIWIRMVLVLLLLFVLLALLVLETVRRQMTRYIFTDRRLYIEQGVVRRSHQSISLPAIQSVTLHQGPLQKIFGIGHLSVHTAAADGKEATTVLKDIWNAAQSLKRIDAARREETIIKRLSATIQGREE